MFRVVMDEFGMMERLVNHEYSAGKYRAGEFALIKISMMPMQIFLTEPGIIR